MVASGATTYQWQVSISGGAWTNLTDGGGYSGTTTGTVGIVASIGMNGNQYRVEVSTVGCTAVYSSVSTLTVVSLGGLPVLTTTAVTGITSTVAITGGDITSDGGSAVTARGVAFGTGSNPTIAGGITIDGSGTGSYTSTLSGLTPSTSYNVRAYATNSVGTAYGSQESFSTLAPPQANQVALRVTNQVAVSSTVYEFDVYLQNTGTNAARFANIPLKPLCYNNAYLSGAFCIFENVFSRLEIIC